MTNQMLWLTTEGGSIRSKVVGWGEEDIRLFNRDPSKSIGMTRPPRDSYTPKTVFQALADGWDLIGLPEEYEEGGVQLWCWWLKK